MTILRKAAIGLLIGTLTLSLASCSDNPPEQPTPTGSTATPSTVTTAAIIEEDLSKLLSAEEIGAAVGVEMNDPTVSNQGTTLTSIAIEGKAVLSVDLEERPREIYEQALQSYFDLTPCPNLGDTAWYSPAYYQLLVYGNGYMMLVELTGSDDTDREVTMLRCRQIAALLLERLPK